MAPRSTLCAATDDYLARLDAADATEGEPAAEQAAMLRRAVAGTQRTISRQQDEEGYERTQARLLNHPEMMALRRQTIEHPFGMIKERILGNARLLLRGLAGACAELNLAVLAYNFRRITNPLGPESALYAARTG